MPPRPLISAAIITLNEAERIQACLDSLAFCDEIVVVDSGSRDGTLDLARRFTSRLYVEPFAGDGAQKNSALSKLTGRFSLLIDADEMVTPSLAQEIAGLVAGYDPRLAERRPVAWAMPRRNHFGGLWIRHGGWYPDYQIRLWLTGRARCVETKVHAGVLVDGPLARLKSPLLHFTYDSVEDYLERMLKYAEGRAEDYHRQAKGARPWTPLIHQAFAFGQAYLFRAGFLDGRLGFRLAWLAGRYTRLKYDHLRRLRRGKPAEVRPPR